VRGRDTERGKGTKKTGKVYVRVSLVLNLLKKPLRMVTVLACLFIG